MDANDLYNEMVEGSDPYAHIRHVVDELSHVATVLTDAERSYLSGVVMNMSLDAPLGAQTERELKELLVLVRQRLHAGS